MTAHPYDGCADCVERVRGLLSEAPRPTLRVITPATAAALERHARRFGPEGVAETAAELGVDVKVEAPTRRRGAKGPSLKARVAAYVGAGHSAEVIAEMENLSPSRARRIIEEVGNA